MKDLYSIIKLQKNAFINNVWLFSTFSLLIKYFSIHSNAYTYYVFVYRLSIFHCFSLNEFFTAYIYIAFKTDKFLF